MAQPQPLKARAHIERKHHIQRNLLEAGEIDFLSNAVVQDLEVGGVSPWTGRPFSVTSTSTRTASIRLVKIVCALALDAASKAAATAISGRRNSSTRDPPADGRQPAAPQAFEARVARRIDRRRAATSWLSAIRGDCARG